MAMRETTTMYIKIYKLGEGWAESWIRAEGEWGRVVGRVCVCVHISHKRITFIKRRMNKFAFSILLWHFSSYKTRSTTTKTTTTTSMSMVIRRSWARESSGCIVCVCISIVFDFGSRWKSLPIHYIWTTTICHRADEEAAATAAALSASNVRYV